MGWFLLGFFGIAFLLGLAFYLGTLEGNYQVYRWSKEERDGFFSHMDKGLKG